jgi:hypothetical protein
MRSNSAVADCTSTVTCSICPTGKNSRLCRVVKATMVPGVIAVCRGFPSMTHPATRYTSAGVIEKNTEIVAKNDRPIICCFSWRPDSFAFSSRNRSIS